MPNATVRANARTLPEATTNRRAMLGAILAAGAIGVAPISAGAASAAEPPVARLGSTPRSLRSSPRPARLARAWRRLPVP